MNALVFKGAWALELCDREEPPSPVRDEVLVRIRATGICGTDVGIAAGEYPATSGVVLGHESTGEVVATGPEVKAFRPGDRVAIDPTFYCGHCRLCRTGRQNHCERKNGTETGVSSDGTNARLHTFSERFLYPLAGHLSFEEGSVAEPLSCAITGVNQLRLLPSLRALVLGGGPMGMLYSWVLAGRGIAGTLVEVSPARRRRCAPLLDSRWSLAESLEAASAPFAEGKPWDVAVDTTGRMAGEALRRLARGGQLLLVGLRHQAMEADGGAIADESLSVQGSIDSLAGSFTSALHLIETGAVPVGKLITHQLPLQEFRQGLALLGCDVDRRRMEPPSDALKVVLHP